jgi:hypothetical protein
MTNLEGPHRCGGGGDRALPPRHLDALDEARPETILDAMAAAMGEVGDRFQCGEMFVPR